MRPETRARILAAAERLRYRPNALARGLKTATTTTFGMLVPSLRNPVYAAIVRGAVAEAWNRGYVVLLAEDDGTGHRAGLGAARRGGSHRRHPGRERRARPADPRARRGEPRAVRVREPARAGQRPQRLDARGGRGAHRRRAPDLARPHAARADRGAARARHRRAPRAGLRRRGAGRRARAPGHRRGAVPGVERMPRGGRADGHAHPADGHLHLEPEPGDRRARGRAPPRHPGARGRLARLLRRRPADRVPRGAADDDPHAAARARRAGHLGARPPGRRRRALRPRDRDAPRARRARVHRPSPDDEKPA